MTIGELTPGLVDDADLSPPDQGEVVVPSLEGSSPIGDHVADYVSREALVEDRLRNATPKSRLELYEQALDSALLKHGKDSPEYAQALDRLSRASEEQS